MGSALLYGPARGQELPQGYVRNPPVEPGLAPGMAVEESETVARTWQVRFTSGDEILSGLTDLARSEGISAAQITGLGGLSKALLAFGDPSIGEMVFKLIPIDEKTELVSLDGTVTGTAEHEYSGTSLKRTYSVSGTQTSTGLMLTGTGSWYPSSFSAVPWQVSFNFSTSR